MLTASLKTLKELRVVLEFQKGKARQRWLPDPFRLYFYCIDSSEIIGQVYFRSGIGGPKDELAKLVAEDTSYCRSLLVDVRSFAGEGTIMRHDWSDGTGTRFRRPGDAG